MGKNRGQKRSLEGSAEGDGERGFELRAPEQLSLVAGSAVTAALKRWEQVRCRVDDLRPALEQEERLLQDILDTGLRAEDRKTLRKLVTDASEAEDLVKQVAASVGVDKARLQEILTKSQRKLLELSTSTAPDYKREVLAEMDAVLDALRSNQGPVLDELQAAKFRGDMPAVRVAGRSLNDLKALTLRLEGERRRFTKNSALAALLVTVCRRVLPARQIEPTDLRDISPSYEGYMQILDFYFFSDASIYCFGEHFSGPNWFTRLKRNIAIFMVHDAAGNKLYNDFAVSGQYRTPGAPLAAEDGPLISIQAEDEQGHIFDRLHDAEFKLLTRFCLLTGDTAAAASLRAHATLWSKKPLCISCAGAVRQMRQRFPMMTLDILVGDPSATESARTATTEKCAHAANTDVGVMSCTPGSGSCCPNASGDARPQAEAAGE